MNPITNCPDISETVFFSQRLLWRLEKSQRVTNVCRDEDFKIPWLAL